MLATKNCKRLIVSNSSHHFKHLRSYYDRRHQLHQLRCDLNSFSEGVSHGDEKEINYGDSISKDKVDPINNGSYQDIRAAKFYNSSLVSSLKHGRDSSSRGTTANNGKNHGAHLDDNPYSMSHEPSPFQTTKSGSGQSRQHDLYTHLLKEQVQFVIDLTQVSGAQSGWPLKSCRENSGEPMFKNYRNGAALAFVSSLYALRNRIYSRMCQHPAQDNIVLEEHREIWRKDLSNQKLEVELENELTKLRQKQIDNRRKTIQSVIDIKEKISKIRKEAQQQIDEITESEQKKIAVETVEYRLQANRCDIRKQQCQSQLNELCLEHIISESALQERRRKAEEKLVDWTKRYDNEMIARQLELDRLQEEYDAEVEEKEHYEHEIGLMTPQYEKVLQKRREREAIAEMEAKWQRKKAAALIILKYWRKYKHWRHHMRKMNKKNKGKKKGKKKKKNKKGGKKSKKKK